MKNLMILILLQSIIPTCYAQKYFRTIPFSHSPLYIFRGGVEVEEEDKTVALYRFDYEVEQLKSIKYQINDKIKPLYENYTSSDFIWAPINEFEYNKNETIVRHYDYLSNPIENYPTVSIYSKDEKGRIIGLKFFNAKNDPAEFRGIHEYRWKYFENGIGEVRYSLSGNIVPMNNWFPYEWVILNFDKHKNLKSILTTNKNWERKTDAIKVDFEIHKNEIVRWVATDTRTGKTTQLTGPRVPEVRHTFNENGYLIMTQFFDEEGNRTKSGWGHKGFKRLYNTKGNRLKYNFINENDEIEISEDRGYSGQKFIWDKNGRFRLKTLYINKIGEPIFRDDKGYAQIYFLYNQEGEAVGEIYKDETGKILNTARAESFILLEDEKGIKERITLKKEEVFRKFLKLFK